MAKVGTFKNALELKNFLNEIDDDVLMQYDNIVCSYSDDVTEGTGQICLDGDDGVCEIIGSSDSA